MKMKDAVQQHDLSTYDSGLKEHHKEILRTNSKLGEEVRGLLQGRSVPSVQDIKSYLGRGPFEGKVEPLLREMRKSQFCISGSRSQAVFLEWLRGEVEESDYDIYTDGTVRHLGDTIKSLKKLGVEFDSLFGEFNDQIAESMGGRLSKSLEQLRMLRRHWVHFGESCNHENVNILFAKLTEESLQCRPPLKHKIDFRDKQSLTLVVNSLQKSGGSRTTDYNMRGLVLIRGRINGIPVQVMALPRKPAEAAIMDFHSSGTQGWINGYMAAHTRLDETRRAESIRWEDRWAQLGPRMEYVREKWESRGIEFVDYPSSGIRGRHLIDKDACIVILSRTDHILTESVPPIDLQWKENRRSTRLVNARAVDLSLTYPNNDFWLHVDSQPFSDQIAQY
ncbi:hypothetical protein Q7P37_009782 [Cladosporium fusiforme]